MNLHFCVSVVFILFGIFATSEGTCEVGECSKTDIHPSYSLYPIVQDACYANQTNVTATCRGESAEVVDMQCQNGNWSKTLNTSCGNCSTSSFDDDVNRFPNDTVIDFDVVVVFNCSNGFNQSGSTKATCTAPGGWVPEEMPKCIAKCETFEIVNGEGPTAVAYETNTTEVSCKDGFTFGDDGNKTTITCQATGEWNNEPTCSEGNILLGALYLVTVSLAMGLVTSNM